MTSCREDRDASRFRWIQAVLLAFAVVSALGCDANKPVSHPAASGLLVERVRPDAAADRAGMVPGDRLTGWSRAAAPPANPEPAAGTLASELVLVDLTLEEAPRGELTLHGERGGVARSWTLPAGDLGLTTRPAFPPELEDEYLRATERATEDGDAAAAGALAAVAERILAEDPGTAAWLQFRAAYHYTEARRAAEAVDAYRAAAEAASSAGDVRAEARIRYFMADTLSRRLGDTGAASREAATAAELWAAGGSELAATAALLLSADVARRRGDLAAAEAELLGVLELRRRWAPGSLYLARTLSVLGKVVATRGDLERAEELMREAAEIRQRLDPGGIDVAHSRSALGTVRSMRGDFAGGEIELRRALERFEADDPRGQNVAVMLGNLGVVAAERGDLVAAEDLHRRALDLEEAMAPDGLGVATLLHNLAGLLSRRGDLEAAEELGRRALAIRRRLAPDSLDVAYSLVNLAGVAFKRGELDASLAHLREALDIWSGLAPDSFEVARTEGDLGILELERGDLAAADRHLFRAEGLLRRLAPARSHLGNVLQRRGEVAEAGPDPASAERFYRSAVEHLSRSAPGTEVEADALWGLARVLRATGRAEEALDAYRRAEGALETQAGRLGGSQEIRSGFRARYRDLYRQHLELELELGRPGRAFGVLERSRARELLAMLHQRDLVFTADLPEGLDAERRRARVAVDRAQEALLEAPPGAGPQEVEERTRTLTRARRKLQEVADRVRAASPRLAALTEPVPATVETALASLDPGTVALAYSLGAQRSDLFVLGAGGLRVVRIAAGEEELRRRVERLRHLLRLGPARERAAGRASRQALSEQARALYRLLVEPAAAEAAGARRLLILPDGPLHLLPFAALETGESDPARRYLGSAVPLHTAASLSVWSEIRQRRGERRPLSLAAFADPEPPFAPGDGSSGSDGWTALRGTIAAASLAPLPASRAEASAVARRFPEARVYVGDEATEGRARAASAGDSHLHFAVHGFLDERFPLSSGLVLARDPDDEGNGLLQAWEIFEGVRTRADLVTLSACETALGAEVAGEGLLGLTRAFQYAGARAVLASLWQVSDRSTAALMDHLYRHLREGLPPADALRAARAELVAGPVSPPRSPSGWWTRLGLRLGLTEPPPAEDFSHPWHWAGFRLDGDWR